MGLAIEGGKNMLTQEAASVTYSIAPADPGLPISEGNHTKVGLVSASVQTWGDHVASVQPLGTITPQPGIWRKVSSYSFVGDNNVLPLSSGLYPASAFEPFDEWGPDAETPAGWQKGAEVTLVDIYSHALEASDVNNHFAATKMSADQTMIYATAANSRYKEFAFSGAEDTPTPDGAFGGGVMIGDGTLVTDVTHTGKHALRLAPGEKGFRYSFDVEPGRAYHAKVWDQLQHRKNKIQVF
jgi:hypothetical protein